MRKKLVLKPKLGISVCFYFMILTILFATIASAALNTELQISGDARFNPIPPPIPDYIIFEHTGNIQYVTVPEACTMEMHVWGAQGGGNNGGRGGYSTGTFTTTEITNVYIVVGGRGGAPAVNAPGGFNGGGRSGTFGTSHMGGGGGGATHISLGTGLLNTPSARNNILVVAGGGGGNGANNGTNSAQNAGGAGGGLSGLIGLTNINWRGHGGTQTAGGAGGSGHTVGNGQTGSAGQGGSMTFAGTGGGGGGGWFGGGAGNWEGGGGGSGHLNNRLTNGVTIAGNTTMPNPEGGTMTGNIGNGLAKIYFSDCEEPGPTGPQPGDDWEFAYTGTIESVELPACTFRLEAWGAEGGLGSPFSGVGPSFVGGRGGYAAGTFTLTEETEIFIAVGGRGTNSNITVPSQQVPGPRPGGFNGGGPGGNNSWDGGAGGGATHISLTTGLLNNANARNNILIAAGGGGGGGNQSIGGAGGGTNGVTPATNTQFQNRVPGSGGTQTAGGASQSPNPVAGPGIGAGTTQNLAGGGGGGWFGGGSGNNSTGGGGGSGHFSSRVTDGELIAGNASMPDPTGGTMTGNIGSGFVRITVIECEGGPTTPNPNDIISIRASITPNEVTQNDSAPTLSVWGTDREDNERVLSSNEFTYTPAITTNTIGTHTITITFAGNNSDNSTPTTTVTYTVVDGNNYPIGHTWDFAFTGDVQEVNLPPGTYQLEVWGASGGNGQQPTNLGGRGGYATGTLTLTSPATVFPIVGGQGTFVTTTFAGGGFNGGGHAQEVNGSGGGGGGATDIRINVNNLNHRIIVAGGGGGGATHSGVWFGGHGGGLTGINAWSTSHPTGVGGGTGTGGSQTAGGAVGIGARGGSFGIGGNGGVANNTIRGGGGGGWFGGAGGSQMGGGGGSGYVKTATSHRPAGYAWPVGNNTFALTSTQLLAGNQSMPNHAGGANFIGNYGHGFARITRVN